MGECVASYDSSLHLNPLGNLHVELEMEPRLSKCDGRYLVLHRGGYAYDYQSFRGVLWPFGRSVRDLSIEIGSAYAVTDSGDSIDLPAEGRTAKTGGDMLIVPLSALDERDISRLHVDFVVTNLVNRDAFFHEMVYALTPPEIRRGSARDLELERQLPISELTVDLSIHFAYGIRSGSIRTQTYDLETGRPDIDVSSVDGGPIFGGANPGVETFDRRGDVIESRLSDNLRPDQQLDVHVQGSHVPFLAGISRPAFWTVVWLGIATLFVISTVISAI